MAKKGKKGGDAGGGKDKKKKEPPPIMIGDVDIRPMDEEQLRVFNKDLVNSIYRARQEQSDSRREMDIIRTSIDNLRYRLDEAKNKRIIALYEADIPDADVVDELNAKRECVKYSEHELEGIKKQFQKVVDTHDGSKLGVLQARKLEMKLAAEIERKKKSSAKWHGIYHKELAYINNKKKWHQLTRISVNKLLKQRFEIAHKVLADRLDKLKECYITRNMNLVLESDKFWHERLVRLRHHYDDCEYVEKRHLRRLLLHEQLMLSQSEEYKKRIKQNKEQIAQCEKFLSKAWNEKTNMINEMNCLRRQASLVYGTMKKVDMLKIKIYKMRKECASLTSISNRMQNEIKDANTYLSEAGTQLKKLDELDQLKEDHRANEYLEYVFRKVAEQLVASLETVMANMGDEEHVQLLIDSMLFFSRQLTPIQFEIVRSVKVFNQLVLFMEKYFTDLGITNPIPLRVVDKIVYRTVPSVIASGWRYEPKREQSLVDCEYTVNDQLFETC